MIHAALGRPVPLELTRDPRVARRVRRLTAISLLALGLVWALARALPGPPPAIDLALLSGWILMPSILAWSLLDQRARYLLPIPAALVTAGLAAICLWQLPSAPLAAAGWLLLTAGVALGGAMGLWLWYRVLPVPAWLDDPYAPARWTLIALHVGLIVAGWALAATGLRAG